MTNHQRRQKVKEIHDLITPLQAKKINATLKHNSIKISLHDNDKESKEKMNALEIHIDKINAELTPLFDEMMALQTKYYVIYKRWDSITGLLNYEKVEQTYFLATRMDIDFNWTEPNNGDEDLDALLKELSEHIHLEENSGFTIQQIKRV